MMSPTRWTTALVAILCMTDGARGEPEGATPPDQRPSLEWIRDSSAGSCPAREVFLQRLARRLGYDPFATETGPHVRVTLARQDGTWHAEVGRGADGVSVTLKSGDATCDGLFDATLTAIAVAVHAEPRPDAPSRPDSVPAVVLEESPEPSEAREDPEPPPPERGEPASRAAEVRDAPIRPDSDDVGPPAKNRFGVEIAQDLVWTGNVDDACGLDGDTRRKCFFEGPVAFEPENGIAQGGEVRGGIQVGTHRVLLSYERLLTSRLGAMLRAGVVFGDTADPSVIAFVPLHAEADLLYHPMDPGAPVDLTLFAGVGMAQVQTAVEVSIRECAPVDCRDDGPVYTLDAYERSGAGFVTTGVGLRGPVSTRFSVFGHIAALAFFPETAIVVQPSAGVAAEF